MTNLTAYAFSEKALGLFSEDSSIPNNWFNWSYDTEQGNLARHTLVVPTNTEELQSWYQRCKLLHTSPLLVLLEDELCVPGWEDDWQFESLCVCPLSLVDPDQIKEMLEIFCVPERKITGFFASYQIDSQIDNLPQKYNAFWAAYAPVLRNWSLYLKTTSDPYIASYKFLNLWPADRRLTVDDFSWPAPNLVKKSEPLYVPLKVFQCSGLTLLNGVADVTGLLPSSRNSEGNWLFDPSGMIERQLLSIKP